MTSESTGPLVSILMPFYNAGDGFQAALQSILNQTYRNWELLLCDDGSTDRSLALAKSIRDGRVTVWSDGKRKGLAARLNECIDRSRGELIARMDADDVSYPERFRRQVDFLTAHPEIDLVGCNMLIFGEDGRALGRRRLPEAQDEIVAHPSLGFGLAHPTWMGRAEWFRQYRYDVSAIRYEDVELLYRTYRTSRFANLPDLLYGYREMRGGFRKRLMTRTSRIRFLRLRGNLTGRGVFYRGALAEAVRIVADAMLVAISGRYIMLKFREERLTASEATEWQDTFTEANQCGAPLINPVRLMVMTTVPDTLVFFSRQLRLLTQDGFEVHTVSSTLDPEKQASGVSPHAVSMERRPAPLHDAISLLRLYRLLRRIRPDILHAHTPKAGLLGMMAARAAGVQVRLYTIHGLPLMTRTGSWRRLLEWAERASCALATHVYTVSPSIQNVAAELNLCSVNKLSTLGDGSCAGIDLERFDPTLDFTEQATALRTRFGIPEDAFLLTFVGRIARDKGIAILDSAWSELARRFPEVHLLIAGVEDSSDPVPEATMNHLRDQERVHFTGGWVAQMPTVYAVTGIVVLPTFREGLPQVALEAGAMGVPVVSTRIPGVVNSVRDGVTGLLVPAGEAAPFVDAIHRLIDDRGLRVTLGKAAREHIRLHFSEQRVNQLWISEYRHLVRKSLPRFVDKLAEAASPR